MEGWVLPEEIPRLLQKMWKKYNQTDFFVPTMEIEDKMDPLEQLLYVDLKSYLSDDILMKVDRASMADVVWK